MKHTIKLTLCTLTFVLAFAATPASAQQQQTSSESEMTPKFGFKAGMNFANLYTSNVQNENVKIGVNGGFYAKIPLVRGLSIQPELLYTSKGAKDTYNNPTQGTGEYRYNLNYIETPLLMVFNLTRNLNLNAGGYLAYLANANVRDVHSDGTISGARDLDANSFNRVDYGMVGGIGFDIENLTLGARYSYGLQNIGQSGNLSGDLTKNSRNSVASFFIGLAF